MKIHLSGFRIDKQLTNKNYFIIMKKLFSFVAMALLSVTTFATQYCQKLLESNDGKHTITLTCEKISDRNYVMTIEGENLQGFGGTFYDPGAVQLSTKITSKTSTKIVCNIDAASDPTFYTPLYVLMPGEVAFPILKDIEWGSCGGEKETIKPVMGEASLESVTYNSAVVNVAGTDKETEDGKVVAVDRFKVVYGETTKIYTATDEKITITGLTAGTNYSFEIYAVDAVGNVSEKSKIVEATTESRESQCSGQCGHFGNPSVKRIAYTIAYDPTEKAVVYTISALNEKKLDFMEVQNTKGSYRVDIPTNDSTTCTFTQTGLTAGEELGIRFHYSTDEIGGNELTAEQISMSDPNIIYYKVGDCAMEIVEDTEKPVMVEATFASATYTSITLNVSAMDNVAVKRYHVVTTGVDKDILPSNGQIVITGLTAGTPYTIDVTAKDAAGNESANTATVSDVKTLSYPAAPAAPVHAQDKVRSIYSDTYTSALAHDFAKNMWSGIQYKEITLDEKNHYLFYTTNVNWIAWGENINGDKAIIAAPGYNDGIHQGLDLSVMDYLHVDIFVDTECVSGEVTINDERLAGLGTLEGGKWNSLNLSLESLKSGLTEEKKEGKINSTRWIKFVGLNGVSMVIIDNVYAWKNGTSTAVDAQEVATKVSKMIENGQVVIIREGVKYDVMGRAIER